MAETKRVVREWRTRLGLTQEAASAKIGYSVKRFNIYDRGERVPPFRMLLAMRAVAHNTPPLPYEDAA